jgi:hypothetical protein
MKALYHFIVKIPKAVKDTIKVGDQEMYLDSKWNEFQNRVSSAEIVAVPEKYNTGAKPGDLLYFHHNVVLGGNHMDGNDGKELKETKGPRGQILDYKEKLYYVVYDEWDHFGNQAFAYSHDNQIHTLGKWLFLDPWKPVKPKSSVIQLVLDDKNYDDGKKYGILKYPSRVADEIGLSVGDTCWIRDSSDYEMEVEGEKVYRTIVDAIHGTLQE